MKRFLLFTTGFLILWNLQSQSFSPEVYASGGGVMENNNAAFHFTIGESFTETFISNDAVFTQGFQQNWDITTMVSEIESDFEIKAFPNPTNDLITIEFLYEVIDPVIIEITDLLGKTLYSETTERNIREKQINLNDYSGHTYLLNIYSNKNEKIKSFKIQKNK